MANKGSSSVDLQNASNWCALIGTVRAMSTEGYFSKRVETGCIFPAQTFQTIARVVMAAGLLVAMLTSPAQAQIASDLPDPSTAPNPLSNTLSLFRSNMQDKIMKSAEAMPESKYSYRPTPDVRSFAEILNHVTDISYFLCSNVKGEATPPSAATRSSKAEIIAALKSSFDYCNGAFSGFTDANLNVSADFFGHRTNKMFILTQVGNHDALHYGNLVTYMRLNGVLPSGGWF